METSNFKPKNGEKIRHLHFKNKLIATIAYEKPMGNMANLGIAVISNKEHTISKKQGRKIALGRLKKARKQNKFHMSIKGHDGDNIILANSNKLSKLMGVDTVVLCGIVNLSYIDDIIYTINKKNFQHIFIKVNKLLQKLPTGSVWSFRGFSDLVDYRNKKEGIRKIFKFHLKLKDDSEFSIKKYEKCRSRIIPTKIEKEKNRRKI